MPRKSDERSSRLLMDVRLDRLTVLDGMRGFAILLVIWYHLWLVSGYGLPYLGGVEVLARNGFLGVDLFFFVSGFCICYPYARARGEGRARPALADFARRRVMKIVPSYVLAVAVFAILYHARFDGSRQEATHVLAHLTFVHVWFRDTYSSLSGPLWTLGVEVQFYILFALVAAQVARRPASVYAAFVLVAVVYRACLAHAGLDADFLWVNQLPGVLDVFGAGMFAAMALAARKAAQPLLRPRQATMCALGGIAIMLAGFAAADAMARAAGDDGVHRWLNAWRITFGPVLALLTLGLTLGTAPLRRIAGTGALAWLSVVSYNAYLWNLEIAVALRDTGIPAWATFWCGAAATLGVAALITYRFEQPIYRRGLASARTLVERVPVRVLQLRTERATGLSPHELRRARLFP